MVEKECCFVENAGGVDKDVPSTTPFQMQSSSFLNVESVHLTIWATCQKLMFRNLDTS